MAPRTVVVTGGNRGIGLGLVKTFLENKDIKHVIATCRKPSEAKDLDDITDSRLHTIEMDVTNDDSIQKAVALISDIVGDDGLTLLVNNAGIFVKYSANQEQVDRAALTRILDTNAVSVIVVSQYFLPLLKKAAALESSERFTTDRAAIVNISSMLGSISDNTSGSGPIAALAYRMSKTALNSAAKTMSIDLKKDHILVTSFCPGWVKTDMGGPTAMLTIDECTLNLVPSIYKLNETHNGGYFKNTLDVIPY